MIATQTSERSNPLVDQVADSADRAIHATQRVANEALDSLAGSVQDMRNHAAPALNRTSDQVAELTQRSIDAVRDRSHQMREKALHASDSTVGYIKDEPVKAMLIAAATGAALMALLGLMTRSRGRD